MQSGPSLGGGSIRFDLALRVRTGVVRVGIVEAVATKSAQARAGDGECEREAVHDACGALLWAAVRPPAREEGEHAEGPHTEQQPLVPLVLDRVAEDLTLA